MLLDVITLECGAIAQHNVTMHRTSRQNHIWAGIIQVWGNVHIADIRGPEL